MRPFSGSKVEREKKASRGKSEQENRVIRELKKMSAQINALNNSVALMANAVLAAVALLDKLKDMVVNNPDNAAIQTASDDLEALVRKLNDAVARDAA